MLLVGLIQLIAKITVLTQKISRCYKATADDKNDII
jgi:hypothetical protein